MMKIFGLRQISGLLLSLFVLGGCQSDITLSSAVRTGDTVTVSLGDANPNGQDANVNTNIIRDTDVTAELTDFSTAVHDVTVRHVFRVYSDPTAENAASRDRAQWMAVIDLIDPVSSNPPSLALGDATIRLSSPKFDADHIVNTHILSGTGTPHPFVSQNEPITLNLDKLQFIRPAKQALVSVTGTLPTNTKLAGAEYTFSIPDAHVLNALNQRVEAVAPAKLPSDQQIYFEFDRTEQTSPVGTDVRVAMTSTAGLEQADLSAFNYVMTSEQDTISNNATYWQTHFTGATFYDTDGQEITALSAQVAVSE